MPAESMFFQEGSNKQVVAATRSTERLTPSQSVTAAERCVPGYRFLGVFTLYSLISVEKWMKSL